MNQSHLTIENHLYVTYEKSETSRGYAWDHLLKNPPPGLVLPGVPIHVLNPYHKYRTVARLPEGMTGKEAMKWAHEEYAKIFEYQNPLNLGGSDESLASTFMRTYTCYQFAKHCSAELTKTEWLTFKKAGGQCA